MVLGLKHCKGVAVNTIRTHNYTPVTTAKARKGDSTKGWGDMERGANTLS